ncbi:SixA phosphatase family protein [Tellurirhabdus bombi]|uniref:SixA phosphatase family protein n=1 Tax=Tellurirhabdus bombi TaxID=2907205 RepID=UPI001F2CDB7A|nr:phosphoglycerate mutase family protein [Tellurirhabdus bombi]
MVCIAWRPFYLTIVVSLAIFSLSSCSTSTIYIVRHAEKVSEADTTSLSPVGFQRAEDLAGALINAQIDSILTTPYRRTRQTAEPLARQLNLPIVSYSARSTEEIVQRLERMKGKNVLVVGHSNTILEIARGLGVKPRMTKIESDDFDNLLRITLERGLFGKSVRLRESTYGEPTPP